VVSSLTRRARPLRCGFAAGADTVRGSPSGVLAGDTRQPPANITIALIDGWSGSPPSTATYPTGPFDLSSVPVGGLPLTSVVSYPAPVSVCIERVLSTLGELCCAPWQSEIGSRDTKGVLCQMTVPDRMPPQLQAWLRANGKGDMVDRGFQPLVAFIVATGQGLPPMPDDVLAIWALMLASERIMVLQGSMAFIRQTRRARKSDEQIRRMLLLGKDTSLDEHLDELQGEVTDIQTKMVEPNNGAAEQAQQ